MTEAVKHDPVKQYPVKNDPVKNQASSTSGNLFGENHCKKNSTKFQVSWSGDVVDLLDGNGTKVVGHTTGCTALSDYRHRNYLGEHFGTLLEYSPNSTFHWDISYVEGFTVPVICQGLYSDREPTANESSGCIADLNGNGGKLHLLLNPTGPAGKHDPGPPIADIGAKPWCYGCSPPSPLWAQCAGSAYTYPFDDLAMGGMANVIQCCVGLGCKFRTGREGIGKNAYPQVDKCKPCSTKKKRYFSDLFPRNIGLDGLNLTNFLAF